VKSGRKSARRELPLRFTEAIDMCAMRVGAAGSDAYLAQWRRGDPVEVDGDIEFEAEKAFERIDREYDKGRLARLVKQGGTER
jgi:Virulence factor